MCLRKISEKLIAEEPLFVFKCLDVIDDKYLTPFQYVPVCFNKKGKCVLNSKMDDASLLITTGIHGYTSFFEALKTIKRLKHSHGHNTEVFLAIIPKGTPYYLGDDNDIVCKKMIIFKNNSIIKDIEKGVSNCLNSIIKDIEVLF